MTMTHARESFAGRLACSGEGKLLSIEGANYFRKNREDEKNVRVNSIWHEVGQVETPPRIGSRRSGNSKPDSDSCKAVKGLHSRSLEVSWIEGRRKR
jgi:hypothetical protein